MQLSNYHVVLDKSLNVVLAVYLLSCNFPPRETQRSMSIFYARRKSIIKYTPTYNMYVQRIFFFAVYHREKVGRSGNLHSWQRDERLQIYYP